MRRSPGRSAKRAAAAAASSRSEHLRRIVVLASGSGTNLQVLLDAESRHWSVVGVITDRPGVRALQRADAAGVPSQVIEWDGFEDRGHFTAAVSNAIEDFGADFIVLAGFMRILGPEAVRRFPNRIINIHPSLLPAFAGAHAVRDALAYGVKMSGVTIHFVDEQLDHGPIIVQEAVPVLPDDDEATLHARIQQVEHRLLPAVVEELAQGKLAVDGRIVKGSVET